MRHYSLIIAGEPVVTADAFEVRNPSTGEVVGYAPSAGAAQLDDAVAAARRAFPAWSGLGHAQRQAHCHAVLDRIADHAEELAQLLTREQGKPLNGLGSRFEMGGVQAWSRHTTNLDMPVKTLQDNNEGRVELHRKPIGVVGSITPWNWPVMIASWHVFPALRAGNTVVIKPSPYTPLATLRMVEIANEVLPPGVLNAITGDDMIARAMTAHPGIDKISFTGSTATGQKIMSNAANTLKRLTLELGGNDAGIVLPDCDPRKIAEGLFWGAFINNGQTCAALKRLYVHDDIYDDVCGNLVAYSKGIPVGDGLEEKNILGPVQNRTQFAKVARLVDDARANGARVLVGGNPVDPARSLFYPLTIVSEAANGMAVVDEEQFGPVLPVIRFKNIEEAIAAANDNPSGLGGSVWSDDTSRAKDIALQLRCGTAWINKHGAIQPNAPFGGVKQSGMGMSFAEEGLNEFTETQVLIA